ncbi:hypothetical protein BHE74_00013729 [Ensete ventricosum]|nr:hypothetical protein BHE74_00013729 [Ensete ventricosum]
MIESLFGRRKRGGAEDIDWPVSVWAPQRQSGRLKLRRVLLLLLQASIPSDSLPHFSLWAQRARENLSRARAPPVSTRLTNLQPGGALAGPAPANPKPPAPIELSVHATSRVWDPPSFYSNTKQRGDKGRREGLQLAFGVCAVQVIRRDLTRLGYEPLRNTVTDAALARGGREYSTVKIPSLMRIKR